MQTLGAQASVVAPNKHNSAYEAKYRGHLLESETYIGGKVEALESGVFRSDLPCHFKLRPEAYQVRHVNRDAQVISAHAQGGGPNSRHYQLEPSHRHQVSMSQPSCISKQCAVSPSRSFVMKTNLDSQVRHSIALCSADCSGEHRPAVR